MTVAEFNDTEEGKALNEVMAGLYRQQQAVLDTVRELTEPVAYGAYVEHDDSGFVESTDI